MEDILQKMPEALSAHLKSLMKVSGFDADSKSQKAFIKNWLKKKALFDKIVEHQDFQIVTRIDPGFRGGIVLLTYSGSLLTVAPEDESGSREIVYNSIDMRKDVVQKTTEPAAKVVFPVELHKSLEATSGRIKKTSPILGMAIEDDPQKERQGILKKLRLIGERISKTLIVVNQELFSKHSEKSELDNRDDLFDQWLILTWFRIGGWEEAVFYTRCKILWMELFSKIYNRLSDSMTDGKERDAAFMRLVNEDFPGFIDEYKWLESEKMNKDMGLMKALEQIPDREDYVAFLDSKLLG
ncbi:MAG: hypothetical protein JW969_20025 [Spirochaetales bacterium]|nr:hypothetical protein [Spirochaetales bacterium]